MLKKIADFFQSNRNFWIVLLAIIAVKIWWVADQPVFAQGNFVHDDRLFINLARYLLEGKWLGEYNNLTLAKGPFYPLWIAGMFALGIPLPLSQHIAFGGAVLFFLLCFRKQIHPGLWLFIFSLVWFQPITYTETAARVLRDSLYPALAIGVLAAALFLADPARLTLRAGARRALGLGIILACFWLTREEGIWILPGLLLICSYGIFRKFRTEAKARWKWGLVYLLPFFILVAVHSLIAGMNYKRYGIYAVVEFKAKPFLAAYGALTRIKPQRWIPDVPMPQEARMRLYPLSPRFSELRPFLEGEPGRHWAEHGGGKEIRGGWFMWALREAATAAGHGAQGREAMHYYQQLAEEVNAACDQKKIASYPLRASMLPPWRKEYFPWVLTVFWQGVKSVATFSGFNAAIQPSAGSMNSLILFQSLTRHPVSPAGVVLLKGWVFHREKKIRLELRKADGNLAEASLQLLPSPDVYESFARARQFLETAREARFQIRCYNALPVWLTALLDGKVVEKIPLDGSLRKLEHNGLRFFLDDRQNLTEWPAQAKLNEIKTRGLNMIGMVYQKIMPWFFGAGLLMFGFLLYDGWKNRTVSWLCLAATACLAAGIFRIFLLAVITVTSFEGINTVYLSPVYPLLLLWLGLTWAEGWAWFKKWIKETEQPMDVAE